MMMIVIVVGCCYMIRKRDRLDVIINMDDDDAMTYYGSIDSCEFIDPTADYYKNSHYLSDIPHFHHHHHQYRLMINHYLNQYLPV